MRRHEAQHRHRFSVYTHLLFMVQKKPLVTTGEGGESLRTQTCWAFGTLSLGLAPMESPSLVLAVLSDDSITAQAADKATRLPGTGHVCRGYMGSHSQKAGVL